MADEHTSETHYLSLKEKDRRHAHTKRLYFNRAFGSDCYHCVTDGDPDAGAAARKETGKGRRVSIKPEAMVHRLVDVLERPQWLIPSRLGTNIGGIPPDTYVAECPGALHEK
jgi:hypothetical protein